MKNADQQLLQADTGFAARDSGTLVKIGAIIGDSLVRSVPAVDHTIRQKIDQYVQG